MVRTVKAYKFTFAEVSIDENNNVKTELKTHTEFGSNEAKAYKQAVKNIGYFKPLKTEIILHKYFIDDETFFKYAVEVTLETPEDDDENGGD